MIPQHPRLCANVGLVLLAALIVAALAEIPAAESSIERTTHRTTTGFVPRLGKRLDAKQLNNLEHILCSQYAGPDCGRILAELSNKASMPLRDTPLMALIGSLVRGIATQEGNLSLAPSEGQAQQQQSSESAETITNQQLELISSLMAQQLERSPRASEEWGALNEMLSVSTRGSNAGTKRVAFTPRIGRR